MQSLKLLAGKLRQFLLIKKEMLLQEARVSSLEFPLDIWRDTSQECDMLLHMTLSLA